MNVHPASNYNDLIINLEKYAVPIANKVKSSGVMGVELHLNHVVADEVLLRIEEFKIWLDKTKLQIFSVNNYPLIDFHQKIVKDKVYLPSWAHEERVHSTIICAKILSHILKKGQAASISTLAGAYRYHPEFTNTSLICENYLKAFSAIHALNQKHSVHITLALEPEPDTTLDTIESVLTFFEQDLSNCAKQKKINMSEVKNVIGLNLDACHASVLFEKPDKLLTTLLEKGINTFKFHITNAPVLQPPYTQEKINSFKKLNEPKYLHQTFAKKNNKIFRFKDLSEFPFEKCAEYDEVRTHYHVPLQLKDFSNLKTTNEEVVELLKASAKLPGNHNFVSETYTWPQHLESIDAKSFDLIDGIAQEVEWLMKTWAEINANNQSEKPNKVQRFGQLLNVKPECLKEYEEYHKNVWPEILNAIHVSGIRNYSIYHFQGQLFGYFEYIGPKEEFNSRMQVLAAAPRMREWWDIMEAMQIPVAGRASGEWWANMKEVFHFD